MKIICNNQEEYDQLMELSERLHWFYIEVKGGRKPITVIYEDGVVGRVKHKISTTTAFELPYSDILNFLRHLYLDEHDFPNKKDYVWIEKKD